MDIQIPTNVSMDNFLPPSAPNLVFELGFDFYSNMM